MISIVAYSKKQHGELKLSENFRVKEFACKDGTDPIFIDRALVIILQAIRSHFNIDVNITSGYRTPSYNRQLKGSAEFSQHLYGMAADITVGNKEHGYIPPKKVAAYVETLLPKSGGIGIYGTFVHIDVREVRSRWNG